MAIPADAAGVYIDSSLPVSPVTLHLSDGTTRSVGGRRVFAATGVTDAAGNVTFNFVTPFAASPVVTAQIQSALADVVEARITALSVNSVTFNVRRSPSVILLGISILQTPINAVGVTVHVQAVEVGNV